MQNIFIIGSKSLGAYGGYETFVNKLTEYHQYKEDIKYYIACKANGDGYMDESKLDNIKMINDSEFIYHNAHCFKIKIPNIGPAQAIYYDLIAFGCCCKYIKKNNIKNPIIYILACRIGPFMPLFRKLINRLGGRIFVNPDGHEWKRAKWSAPIRKYWKLSEQLMIKYSDLIVCDSINIQKYVKDTYKKYLPKTTFIAYGTETRKSNLSDNDEKLLNWYKDKQLSAKNYYLVVGRFVPENNYETMIREFMKSDSTKDFALITNVNDNFLDELENRLQFKADKRIKFVGTVYDQELLMKIRENAFAYIHGHEVGGTNPSLLEALGSTDLNLLLNVGFNMEVAENTALYWNKNDGNLANLINRADKMNDMEIFNYAATAKERISKFYSWELISDKYHNLWKTV